MKKVILGILLGVVVLAVFLYFGGSKCLRAFGSKTEEAGVKLEKYEKQFREKTDEAGKTVKETAVSAKKTAARTYDKTKEKVKEYMPE